MEKKIKYLIIAFFVSPVVFFFIYSLLAPSHLCQLSYDFKKSSYNGVVVDKYIDQKNHSTKTIIIKINNNTINMILPRDTSSFFDYVTAGDTLLKKEQNNSISVYRKNSTKAFKIYFGCE